MEKLNKFKIGDTVRIKLPDSDNWRSEEQYAEFYNRWHNVRAIVIEVIPERNNVYKLSSISGYNTYWDERNLKHCRLDKLKRILQK